MKKNYIIFLIVLLLFNCKTLFYKPNYYQENNIKGKLYLIYDGIDSSNFEIRDLVTDEIIYSDKIDKYNLFEIININNNIISFYYRSFDSSKKQYQIGILEYNIKNKQIKDLGIVEQLIELNDYEGLIIVKEENNKSNIFDIDNNFIISLNKEYYVQFILDKIYKKIYYLNYGEIRCIDLKTKKDILIYDYVKDPHIIVGLINIKNNSLVFENVSWGEFHYLSFINIDNKKIYDFKGNIMANDFKLILE